MAHSTQRRAGGKARYADFIGIERSVADSPAFVTLPIPTRALYLDLRRQYNGKNNGDICAADSILEQYGWAHSSIAKNLRLLLAHGLIIKTRQGGIGAMSRTPTLYGFTDQQIMANPAKGIAGAMPSLAYRQFSPAAAQHRPKKQNGGARRDSHGTRGGLVKVHAVTDTPAKIHAVDFGFPSKTSENHCDTRLFSDVA